MAQSYPNEGRVRNLGGKDFNGTTLYSFQLEGNNRWFRTGEKRPNCENGDYVKFMNDAKANVDVQTLEKTSASTQPAQSGSKQSTGTKSGGGKKGGENWDARQAYWEAKEVRDVEIIEPRVTFQGCRNKAIELVIAGLENDCLSLGSAKGKRWDLLLAYVDSTTDRLFLQAMHAHEHLAELESGESLDANVVSYDDDEE